MTAWLWDEWQYEKHAQRKVGEGVRALMLQIAAVLDSELTPENVEEWVADLNEIFDNAAEVETE